MKRLYINFSNEISVSCEGCSKRVHLINLFVHLFYKLICTVLPKRNEISYFLSFVDYIQNIAKYLYRVLYTGSPASSKVCSSIYQSNNLIFSRVYWNFSFINLAELISWLLLILKASVISKLPSLDELILLMSLYI